MNPTPSQILVVDDDLISRTALASVLRRLPGAEVVQASDGLAAWQLLQDGLRPHACCTDLGMPGLDGLGLMDRVRAHPILDDLPVVLITGTADRDTVLAAMQRGAAGYIVKPFVAADTLNTLQRILRAAHLRRCEAPAATRSRLHQDAPALAHLLESLREQALALHDTPQPGDEAAWRMRLDGLRSGCLTLGLWRAAELIQSQPAPGDGSAPIAPVLDEVARLASQQLRQLGLAADARG